MTNNAHNFAKIKHQLLEKKRHGEKSVVWKLTADQNRYVNETLHMTTEPEIYLVRTRKIYTPGKWTPIVREVNYAYKRKTFNLYRRLNNGELNELARHDVQVVPFKYRVYLNK